MKSVLCFGDSNTWGWNPSDQSRYSWEVRWPGLLAAELGSGSRVIEEGLPGRTTVMDDPFEGSHMNGRTYLLPCLFSHRPIDVVVLMLGTNDLKRRFNVPATDIAAGCGILLDMIAASRVGPDGTNPKCLLVTPPPILDKTSWDGLFGGRAESSRELALNYAVVAEERRVAMFNAGDVLQSSDVDGVHWDADAHYRMGLAVAERIIQYIYPGVDYAGQPHK